MKKPHDHKDMPKQGHGCGPGDGLHVRGNDHTREPGGHEHAKKQHHHRGKSSETFLDKSLILRELGLLPGQIVLDAGCGNGYMSKAFSEALANTGKVYALDPDESAITTLEAETQGTNIEAIIGDITTATPLEPASIDLIYLANVLHGFSPEQITGFQTEACRLLKPHGKLAIVEIEKRDTPFGPPLDIRFSPEELRAVFTLTPRTMVKVGEYFYMQIFAKCGEA